MRLVLAALVVLAGACDSGTDGLAGAARCAEVGVHVAREADPDMRDFLGARAIRHCVDDAWSPELTRCLRTAGTDTCEHLATSEQLARLLEDSPFEKPLPLPASVPVSASTSGGRGTASVTIERYHLEVTFDGVKTSHSHGLDNIDHGALTRRLHDPRPADVELTLTDEATHQHLVTTMNALQELGIAVELLGEGPTLDGKNTAAVTDVKSAAKQSPIVVVTSTEISLLEPDATFVPIVTLDALAREPGGPIPALARALEALPPHPALAVVQADGTTRGVVMRRIISTLRQTGHDVVFAIKYGGE